MLSQHPSYNFDMVLNKDNATCGMYALGLLLLRLDRQLPTVGSRWRWRLASLKEAPKWVHHQFVCASHRLLDSC